MFWRNWFQLSKNLSGNLPHCSNRKLCLFLKISLCFYLNPFFPISLIFQIYFLLVLDRYKDEMVLETDVLTIPHPRIRANEISWQGEREGSGCSVGDVRGQHPMECRTSHHSLLPVPLLAFFPSLAPVVAAGFTFSLAPCFAYRAGGAASPLTANRFQQADKSTPAKTFFHPQKIDT